MKTEGIVFKAITYKETSKIVYLYTPNGKVSVKAIGSKNSKKKTFGFGEIGNIVSFVITDQDFPTLIEYEILNYLPDDSIHNKIYPFIKDIMLNLLDNPLKALSIFLIKMTYNFGVAPKFDSCIICGNKNNLLFSVSKGSVICNNCNNGYIDNIDIWMEYYKDKKNIKEYKDTDFKLLLKRINEYYLIHAHINLKIN